jgi:peroxidase
MKKAYDFDDLIGYFDNRTLHRMATLYKSVDDIDLWTAGISEYPAEGSMLGPVFNCLMAEQFVVARNSDRFWYESDDPLAKFSLEQLAELRKSTLARLICDNSDDIDTVQLYPFLQPDQMV